MNEDHSSNLESDKDLKSAPPKQFLNIVLHELRPPMTVIQGYVEILSDEKQKEHHLEAIKAISDSLARIEKLCEDMADYLSESMQNPDS